MMSQVSAPEITQLLSAQENGDESALEMFVPLIHAELYGLAKGYMDRERPDHPVQPTVLVNEAYIQLIDWRNGRWQNRGHFFGVAAQMMRHILVDFTPQRRRSADGAALHLKLMEISKDKRSIFVSPADAEADT